MTDDLRMGASSPSAPTALAPASRAEPLTGLEQSRSSHGATPDAGTALLRSVRAEFAHFGGFVLEELTSRRWASVTFRGARHTLAFRLEGDGADVEAARFASSVRPDSYHLPGHLLADIRVVSEERRPGRARIILEALTVEDK